MVHTHLRQDGQALRSSTRRPHRQEPPAQNFLQTAPRFPRNLAPILEVSGEKRAQGPRLRLGEIRVEVADFYGKTLPGHSFDDCNPIIGDQYRVPVTWKHDDTLGIKTGEPVVLRFRITKAKVYELDFE